MLAELDVVFLCWRERPAMLERHHDAVALALPAGWDGTAMLVENAGPRETSRAARALVRSKYPQARGVVLRPPRNMGFARAMDLALSVSAAPFCAILNADGVPSADMFGSLVDALEARPDAVWAAPGIHGPGEACHPPGPPREEERLSGVALVIRRARFLELGGFDPAFFFYNEDFEASERLRCAGAVLLRVPATAVHHGRTARSWRGRALRERHFAATDQQLRLARGPTRGAALARVAWGRARAVGQHARDRDGAGVLGLLTATALLPAGAVHAERRRRRPWDGDQLRAWVATELPRVERVEL